MTRLVRAERAEKGWGGVSEEWERKMAGQRVFPGRDGEQTVFTRNREVA